MATRPRADDYLNIDRGSKDRYRRTRMHTDALVRPDTLRYGTWNAPTIDTTDAQRHTVTRADVGQMDLIAYKYYKEEELWWAIAWVNRIKNPLTDMAVGQQLLIPSIQAITTALAG